MKQATLLFCAIAFLLSCKDEKQKAAESEAAIVKTAAATPPATETRPDSATMMKNWMEYMEPAKEHKMMASWDGTWKTDITMWMAPDAPPSKTSGTTVNKTVLGGRYQQSTNKATWEGMPFEGQSTLAFDNFRKVFISTWIDNMGTGLMVAEGPWDETTKSIMLKGKMMDPTLRKEIEFRQVFKVVDDNTQEMEMFSLAEGGKEFKTMEMRYVRSK